MKKILFVVLILLTIPFITAKSGSMKLLAVSNLEENPRGSLADLYLEIKEGSGRVFIDSFPLSKLDTQISTRFAKEIACNFIEVDCSGYDFFYTIRANSNIVGGPSAGAAITVLTVSVLEDLPLNKKASITGTINTGGIIGPVGSVLPKIDSASKSGIKKILIPKYSQINNTNLTEYENEYNVDIVEISQLKDAIKVFTGKDYSNNGEVNLSSSYVETMREISIDLCERAEQMTEQNYEPEDNSTAQVLLQKGKLALDNNQHYSAASYCFGSGLNSRNKQFQDENLTYPQILSKIRSSINTVESFENITEKYPLKTLTDLETYMAVIDRTTEAKDRLHSALSELNKNNTEESLYELAYALERLNSAKSWAVFFGTPGREFNLNKKVLEESCLKKISEVEERIQYVNLYMPRSTEDAKESVKKSYIDYNEGNPELCLYKSSIAKAKIDLILNSMSINPDYVDDVIEDRLNIVKSLIAKQNQRGIFPIVAYSYYEYADTLKETDKYSALLYLEYALELSSLDIYFEKKAIKLPEISSEYFFIFVSGLLIGTVIGIMLVRKPKKKR